MWRSARISWGKQQQQRQQQQQQGMMIMLNAIPNAKVAPSRRLISSSPPCHDIEILSRINQKRQLVHLSSLRHFSCPSPGTFQQQQQQQQQQQTSSPSPSPSPSSPSPSPCSSKNCQNHLVYHFQSLVDDGTASNDEHQLKALTQLDGLRNQILSSEFYTPNPPTNAHSHSTSHSQSSSSSSLGDGEEIQTKSSIPSSVTNYISTLFSNKSLSKFTSSLHDNYSYAPRIELKGVYLHGGVGCGKTFCMNLFYDSLPDSISKQKVHFHSFMLHVHKQMHEAKMVEKIQGDVLPHIINKTIQNGIIICFDEFQVTDVADALILRRLFTGLLGKGAVIISTSNRPPSDLYLNGLQRDLFLPFIDLLQEKTNVISMWESDVDYRLVQGKNKARGVYFIGMEHNDDDGGKPAFEYAFTQLTKGSPISSTALTTQGRIVPVPKACLEYGVARFSFDDLCRQARGAADYLLIGEHFHTVFVEDVPSLTMNDVNLVRRFIIFVDAMYECHIKLIIHADTGPENIFKVDLENQVCDEVFAFDRTRSRLEEMGSDDYLRKSWVKVKSI